MYNISINSRNMSGKTWYTATEVADIVVNLPDDNSPNTNFKDEDELDMKSDLEDIYNLPQPESETETSEIRSSSQSKSVEEANAHFSEEEQQPALPNARFMATSLSNHVDNLIEGIHKIKSNDCE